MNIAFDVLCARRVILQFISFYYLFVTLIRMFSGTSAIQSPHACMRRIMYEVCAKTARSVINWYHRDRVRTTTDYAMRMHWDKEIHMQRPFELIMMLNVAILLCTKMLASRFIATHSISSWVKNETMNLSLVSYFSYRMISKTS